MADTKISDLTALAAAPATNDIVPIVDVSDTTMAATGTNKKITIANLLANYQPLDSDLTAIAALTTTTFGRALLTAANSSDLKTMANLVIGTHVQAWDADLDALAAISGVQGDIIYHNGTSWVRLAAGTNGNFLKTQGAGANPTWAAPGGGGDLLSTNNLSDVANPASARSNLGLAIGTHVQAWDADLDTWAGKTAPSGTVVGTSDSQTLTNKSIDAGQLTGTVANARLDTELQALGGLTSAADKGIQFTGSGTAATYDLTAAGKALLDDASVAAQRVTLRVDQRVTVNNTTYTVLATDTYVAQTGTMSASRAFTLPAASAFNAGQEVVIADESGTVTATNTIVITRAGSDTINGATTETISSAYGWRRLISDGTSKWTFDGGILRHSLATAKGDILVASAAGVITRLPVGSNTHVLTADSGEATGVKWAAGGGGGGSVATDTIFDAKGDLAVGTGSDTAAKLTVGSNGKVPFADSAAATGLTYGFPLVTIPPNGSAACNGSGLSNGAEGLVAVNRLYYILLPLMVGYAYTNFGVRVAAASTAAGGGVLRIGLYTVGNDGKPGSLITDGGTVSSESTGQKFVSISYTPKSPWVYGAVVGQTNITSLTLGSSTTAGMMASSTRYNSSGTVSGSHYRELSVSGGLPATATPVETTSGDQQQNFIIYAY